MRNVGSLDDELYLGIEGGGTRTVVMLGDSAGKVLRREEFGPANFRLLTEQELTPAT